MSFISLSRASIDNGDIETAGPARCWHLLTAAISLLEYQMALFGGIFSEISSEPPSMVSQVVFYGPSAPETSGVLVKNANSQARVQVTQLDTLGIGVLESVLKKTKTKNLPGHSYVHLDLETDMVHRRGKI